MEYSVPLGVDPRTTAAGRAFIDSQQVKYDSMPGGRTMNNITYEEPVQNSAQSVATATTPTETGSGFDFDTYFEKLGNLVSGYQNTANEAARKQREFNSKEAELNRQFQKEMSDTAYQRQVKDMEAAGLNPLMMYAHGLSGASTPSGSAASAQQAETIAPTEAFSNVITQSMRDTQSILDRDLTKKMYDNDLSFREKELYANTAVNVLRSIIPIVGMAAGADVTTAAAAMNNMDYIENYNYDNGKISSRTKSYLR